MFLLLAARASNLFHITAAHEENDLYSMRALWMRILMAGGGWLWCSLRPQTPPGCRGAECTGTPAHPSRNADQEALLHMCACDICRYAPSQGFLSGSVEKNLPAKQRRLISGFDPWVRKIPWRKWQPTPVFLPAKSHGQSLVGYSPWGCKRSNVAWWLSNKAPL